VLTRLQEALAGRGPGLVAVLFVDLDGFKLVNDALGHAAGDRVLVDAAARLREAVRTSDTVGRFGGDEFLVVCPSLTTREEGLLVARRIERAIARPFALDGDEVLVGASVGVAFADPAAARREGVELSGAALVEDADSAMYRAKQGRPHGRRRFEVFDSAMRERAEERGRLERLLARAVEEDRVVVEYQPVVELVSRRVVGLEALVRLCDDDGTLLAPDAFLAVARENGVLARLDDVVLDRATRAVAGWRRELGRDLELSVNVCAQQVAGDLPDKVDRALADSGLPADRLVVELTEQTLMSSAAAAGRALQRLADRGVQLALDDFGTGWASLTYLRRYPVRQVKVDRSFVAGLPHEPGDRVVVQAVVDLSAQLGLGCVAEGVETEEQYDALTSLRPPFAQGYLFSPPLAGEDVVAALSRA
jgi:diguanylate cyclase (GGDEF)-like protein